MCSWPVATSRRKTESSLIIGLSICLPSCIAMLLLLWHFSTILSSCFCRSTSKSPSKTHCTSETEQTHRQWVKNNSFLLFTSFYFFCNKTVFSFPILAVANASLKRQLRKKKIQMRRTRRGKSKENHVQLIFDKQQNKNAFVMLAYTVVT